MKRAIAFFLSFVLCFSLCACHPAQPDAGSNGPSEHPSTPPATVLTPTTAPAKPIELVSEVRTDVVTFQPQVWSSLSSGVYGISVVFDMKDDDYPNMTVTFDVSVDCGTIRWYKGTEKQNGAEVCIDNRRVGTWRAGSDQEAAVQKVLENAGAVFLDIIVRADGNIVGYGICEIASEDGDYFAPVRCEMVCFPMIDGQLQAASEEYVAEKLAELKQTVTPFNFEDYCANMNGDT